MGSITASTTPPIQPAKHAPETASHMGTVSGGARTRVLIVDDHPLFCEGLSALLGRVESFDVVGQAWTSDDALAYTRQLKPDMILLDISLDNDAVSGLDLIHRLRRMCPDVRIAVLTAHTGNEYLMSALRLDVQAFLEKGMPPAALLAALQQVRNGERIVPSPHHMTMALAELGHMIRERDRAHSGLTDQEIEMLRLAASGSNNKAIGAYKFWSEITVKRKMQAIYRKLGVSSRAQAVAEAIRLGFI
jgi:DNA-binding NarL/FixJ family response regulator